MARIEFSPELTTLIKAQRMQDQKKEQENDALDAMREALETGDEDTIAMASDRLDEASNFYEAAILERIDAERTYRTWIERQQAHAEERKSA